MRKLTKGAVVSSAAASLLALTAVSATGGEGPAAAHPVGARVCAEEPITMGYYRVWRDVATSDEEAAPLNSQEFSDVPPEVDIVSAFATPPEQDPGFWAALENTYLKKLHAQGTEVVFTIFVDELMHERIPLTEAGYQAEAQALYDEFILKRGLDGLDIDMEKSASQLSADDITRATGVMKALGQLIGPQSGTDKLFIYDTNQTGNHPIFEEVAPYVDYVFLQAYGRSPSSLQGSWETFAPHISSCQFLPGFSFYEERGAYWNDITPTFEESRAVAYADWQPAGGEKGGIFAYAIDRDGTPQGDDTITRTDFSWMIALTERMLAADIEPTKPDTTAPEVAVTVAGLRVVLTATDDQSIATGSATLTPTGRTAGSTIEVGNTGTLDGSGNLEQSWALPEDLTSGRYLLTAEVADAAGNISTADATIVVTPKNAHVRN